MYYKKYFKFMNYFRQFLEYIIYNNMRIYNYIILSIYELFNYYTHPFSHLSQSPYIPKATYPKRLYGKIVPTLPKWLCGRYTNTTIIIAHRIVHNDKIGYKQINYLVILLQNIYYEITKH